MRSFRLLVFALLPLGACNCDDDEVIPVRECNLRTVCNATEAFRNGQCVPARCSDDGDCCAGRRCAAAGKCSPVEERCGQDADCEGLGILCLEEEGTRRCRPPRCDNDTDCEIGTCFEGRCLVDVPCTEACEAGTYCDISARRCVAAPAKSVGCEQKCPEGQRKMLSDPLSMRGDSCCETICECKALPALVPRDVGLHLSARAAAGRILVAAYERHYGDLVLISLDEFGNQLGRVFVDGFDGDQPRHKSLSAEVGPHVGTYPSIAIAEGGKVYIAYRDEDAKDLKLAWQQGDGWRRIVVDGRGDTGLQPHLRLTEDGRPQIAYRVRFDDGVAGLRLAEADRPDPSSSGHWRTLDVDVRSSCIEGCEAGSVCIAEERGDRCLAQAEGCDSCSGGSVCTEDSGTVQCRPAANRTGSVPEDGIGMAPQLLRNDDGLLLVYGDSVASLIRVASIRGGRIFGNEVLDGAGGALGQVEGGVGTDLGAAMDGATLIVAYRNHIDQSIRLYSGTVDLSGERIVFDEGTALSQEPGGLDRLHGADLDVMQMNGQRAVSFQDQSLADASAWVGETRFQNRTTQPDGFSTDLVWLDGRYFVVHARLRTDPDGVTRFAPVVTALAEAN